jgi:hypothetical protein
LNVLSETGSDPDDLEEFKKVAGILVNEGFKCVEVVKD